jgi:beta-lactamase class A
MRDYSTYLKMNREIEKKPFPITKKILFVLFFTLIISGIFGYWRFIYSNGKTFPDEIKPSLSQPTEIHKTGRPFSDLENTLNEQLNTLPGTYAIYVVDINNGKTLGIHEQTIFTAASVNKIPILAAVYHLAGKGDLDLNKQIILQAGDIQDYGSGSIRYDPVGTPYSIRTLSRLLIEKSDNTAAYILANMILNTENIQKLIETWGLTQTSIINNETSAKDMALLMMKMYKGEITTPALTPEMMDFMKKSDYEDRIPKLLPGDISIYHKTGDEIGKWHDVGIVDLPQKPYFVGIFSMDTTDEEKTKQTIAQISKTIFDFMK